jgi:hypothetical protein
MPFYNAPATTDALSGNGDSAGYVTVASNAKYYPGAKVWLRSSTQESKQYIVTDLNGTTKIGLREVLDSGDNTKRGPQYGRTPLTQWLTADGAQICQEPSTVAVEWDHVKQPLIP